MAGPNLGPNNVAVAFGILGNIISFMVYLAPLPTFYRIWRRKSTEGFHCVPYLVALFSAMLWIYYALLKPHNDYILLIINGFGCCIQTFYIVIFLIFASTHAKVFTLKLLLLLNVGLYGLIVVSTMLLTKGSRRLQVLGWICVGFSVSVFAAPLSIIRRVIRTRSVEFMPFYLSLFLTISAVAWFCYGFFSKDVYVAVPNVLGFLFGMIQMILYFCYKNTPSRDMQAVDIESIAEPDVGPQVCNIIEDDKCRP